MKSEEKLETKIKKMSSSKEIFASLFTKITKIGTRSQELANQIVSSIYDSNIKKLKELCLNGIPDDIPMLRSIVWKILLNYIPIEVDKWNIILPQKREEYHYYKEIYIKKKKAEYENKTYEHQDLLSLIAKDINRTYSQFNTFFIPTSKDTKLSQEELFKIVDKKQTCSMASADNVYKINEIETHADVLERILYIYSQLSPDVAYRQGMNEILAPIYFIFYYDKNFEEDSLENLEADSFWTFFNLMKYLKSSFDNTDPYNTFTKCDILIKALHIIDHPLAEHLSDMGVTCNMFCFRWFILLFGQDLSINDLIRFWDIVFTEDNKFYYIFLFALAVFENKRDKVLQMDDFSDIILEFQDINNFSVYDYIQTAFNIKEQYSSQLSDLLDIPFA